MGGGLFNPDSFAVGGGLLDDVDVIVKQARIVMFDYNGTQPEQPAVELTLEHGGEETTQAWTVGKAADWQPSEDGTQLIAVGRATQINASSNAAILLKSLVDAGFPGDKLGDSITILEGLEGHVMRVPAPVRKGLKDQKEGQTILTFASITKLPWDKAGAAKAKPGAKGKAAAAKAPEAPPEAPEPDSIEAQAQDILLELIAAAGDAGVAKASLPSLVYKQHATNPNKKEIVQKLFDDAFLKAGPWTYAGGKLTLG